MVNSEIRETVNGWLVELDKYDESLLLDPSGQCFIVADEQVGMVLCVPPGSGQFFFYADVLAVPHAQPAQFYEELLAYNAMPEVTLGLVLAFDQDARAVVAMYSADVDSHDALDFRNVIGNMTDTVISLRLRLEATLRGIAQTEGLLPANVLGQSNLV